MHVAPCDYQLAAAPASFFARLQSRTYLSTETAISFYVLADM